MQHTDAYTHLHTLAHTSLHKVRKISTTIGSMCNRADISLIYSLFLLSGDERSFITWHLFTWFFGRLKNEGKRCQER